MGNVAKLKKQEVVANDPAPVDPIMSTIERLATNKDVNPEVVAMLFDRLKEQQESNEERAFNVAMVACQKELKPITRRAFNKQTKSNYAKLEHISKAVDPIIHKHGFSCSFGQLEGAPDKHIRFFCDVRHEDGHKERYLGDVPIDDAGIQGTVNKTGTHAYGSTMTYGRRYVKCSAFDIQVTDDDDGNGPANAPITEEQAERLRELLDAAEADIQAFCEMYEIDQYADLPASKWDAALVAIGRVKEKNTEKAKSNG